MANDLFETGGVAEKQLRAAVFVHRFPLVSETFIINQVVGLIRLGEEVDIYSFGALPPNAALTQPDVAQYRLLERTKYPAASPRDGLKLLRCGVRQAATLLSKQESNSVSGACAGLSGGGNERQVMKPLGNQFARDPSCERKRLHILCGIFAGVSGLSIPRVLQGAVHIADLRIAETERGDGLDTTTGTVRIERLLIERVPGRYEGEVVIGGAGTQIGWVRSINLYKPSLANRSKGQSKSPV